MELLGFLLFLEASGKNLVDEGSLALEVTDITILITISHCSLRKCQLGIHSLSE